ncbi:MAG: tRNA-binding protein [Gemmatimonadales bacterium]
MAAPIGFDDFTRVDIRVGRVVAARLNPAAIKPAFHLEIDFGPDIGVKHSSAQLTVHYAPGELVGRLVIAVVNFAPRRIASVKSEVLVLGVPDADGAVILLRPDLDAPLGGKMF